MKVAAALACAVTVLASSAAEARRTEVPSFRHVVVIIFENKEEATVLRGGSAPTFDAMARRYARLTNYYGVAHPSLPNYLALVAGSTFGISSDCTSCSVSARNLADTLAAVGKTWKLYAEGLPYTGFTGSYSGEYAKKHAPFLYFRDVVRSSRRLRRVVPLSQLRRDLRSKSLPDFAFVVPNLCHSMHDCSVSAGDAWLKSQLPPLLRLANTVVFVVFDEGTSSARGGGHVPALVVGTAVARESAFRPTTSHYGLLRTVEDAWGLPRLGRSSHVRPITGIWR